MVKHSGVGWRTLEIIWCFSILVSEDIRHCNCERIPGSMAYARMSLYNEIFREKGLLGDARRLPFCPCSREYKYSYPKGTCSCEVYKYFEGSHATMFGPIYIHIPSLNSRP